MLLNYLIYYKLRNNYLSFFPIVLLGIRTEHVPCVAWDCWKVRFATVRVFICCFIASLLSLVIAQRYWEVWGANVEQGDLGANSWRLYLPQNLKDTAQMRGNWKLSSSNIRLQWRMVWTSIMSSKQLNFVWDLNKPVLISLLIESLWDRNELAMQHTSVKWERLPLGSV